VRNRILLVSVASLVFCAEAHAQGSPANGQIQFGRRCSSCHSVIFGQNQVGPYLLGVVGRPSGTAVSYRYSVSYTQAGQRGLAWGQTELHDFLANPTEFLKAFLQQNNVQTRMTVRTSDKQARLDIIAYLAMLTGLSVPPIGNR
jgi:cytochrome c